MAALRLGVAAGAAALVDPVAADRRVARARGQDLGRYSALSCDIHGTLFTTCTLFRYQTTG